MLVLVTEHPERGQRSSVGVVLRMPLAGWSTTKWAQTHASRVVGTQTCFEETRFFMIFEMGLIWCIVVAAVLRKHALVYELCGRSD